MQAKIGEEMRNVGQKRKHSGREKESERGGESRSRTFPLWELMKVGSTMTSRV